MSERNSKLELLGSAPIPKALMSLGVPIMIGMLINALYNLVDAYFVGGLGESQMGAISIVFPLGQVVVGLGLMFGNGAASYLSRLLGRGDKDSADQVASTALYSSVLVGVIIILLATLFMEPILTMLGATETILPYALTYARIYVISCIFNVFNVTMNNIVSSEGAAKTTMCALLLGAVLNTVLDPIFIYTLNPCLRPYLRRAAQRYRLRFCQGPLPAEYFLRPYHPFQLSAAKCRKCSKRVLFWF